MVLITLANVLNLYMNNTNKKSPSAIAYLRDIIVFPFMVTFIIPYFLLYNKTQALIPDNVFFKVAGIVFFVAGLILFLSTNYLFVTVAKGTLAPWSPKEKL